MQIVIDIPEEEYERLIYIDILKLRGYIESGTPLSKSHGRIIDVNKMEYLKAIHDAKYGKISWSEAIKQIKNSAPTILTAR